MYNTNLQSNVPLNTHTHTYTHRNIYGGWRLSHGNVYPSHLNDYTSRQQQCYFQYVDTAVEGSELNSHNKDDNINSVVSNASCRRGWALFQLRAEKGIEKQAIQQILRKDLHLHKIALKWVLHTLNEVGKWKRYEIFHLLISFFNPHYS